MSGPTLVDRIIEERQYVWELLALPRSEAEKFGWDKLRRTYRLLSEASIAALNYELKRDEYWHQKKTDDAD